MSDQRTPPDVTSLPVRLETLQSIVVSGTDARSFLQGQLSFDMARLTPGYVELASINSAQGRVQAVVWLIERTDAIVMILPGELIDATVARLAKFTLRAKVTIASGVDRWQIGACSHAAVPQQVRGHAEDAAVSVIHWPGLTPRGLMLTPVGMQMQSDPLRLAQWHLDNIRAGLPAVYVATRESFVAQMLNLDLLQGISFDKGCYTGQEIIARMHFRGQVKRRMLRFSFAGPAPAPGTRIVTEGNHAGDVVDAAAAADGSELLAVINLTQADAALEIDGAQGKLLQRLPLPYDL